MVKRNIHPKTLESINEARFIMGMPELGSKKRLCLKWGFTIGSAINAAKTMPGLMRSIYIIMLIHKQSICNRFLRLINKMDILTGFFIIAVALICFWGWILLEAKGLFLFLKG